jgi:hypothetical protein
VQDPSGKTVLVVDGDSVKDPSGKAVLTIDGDNIKDPGGKLVLYCNGDNIRNEPNGALLLFIDGRHIKREPGGTNLLYVDGKNLMRGDRSGKPLYHFDGDEVGTQQRMAILYAVMPEIFKKTDDAALVTAQAKAASAEDSDTLKNIVPGDYKIDIFHSSDTTTHKGTVAIAKVGDVFVMTFTFTQGDLLQGVAIQHGDDLWAAVGPASTVGLAIYAIDHGNLKGTWYNVSGKPESFGSENLSGPEALAGDYAITSAKAPFTGAAYTGKVTLESAGKKFDGGIPLYNINWDLGGYKAKGVGFSTENTLVVATSTAADFSIIHFKIDIKQNTLSGQYFSASKDFGFWSLKKSK